MSLGKGIKLSTGFDLNSKSPLDNRTVFESIAERNSLPDINLYEGLECFVKETKLYYQYINNSWQERKSGGGEGDVTLEYLNSNYYNNTTMDDKLSKKVNAEAGKGLSSNDFTNEEKLKLTGLNNYDDTEIRNIVEQQPADLSLNGTTLKLKKADGTTIGTGVVLPDRGEEHTHDNKTVLDDITNVKVSSWDSKAEGTHEHDADYAVKSSEHTHSNKVELDKIEVGDKAKWDNKSDFNGDYNNLINPPTIPTVTNDLTNELKGNYDKAYTHSTTPHAPSNAQRNADITKSEIEAKLTGEIATHTHANNGDKSVSQGDTAPADNTILWVDTTVSDNFTGNIEDRVLDEFRQMIIGLNKKIEDLRLKNIELEGRIAYLEENGIKPPEPPEPPLPGNGDNILAFEDNSIFTDENGDILIFEVLDEGSVSNDKIMTLESGETLIDENGNLLILENDDTITSFMLKDKDGNLLYDKYQNRLMVK